eukprot:4655417-Pyramimonas_sp.AAC.1
MSLLRLPACTGHTNINGHKRMSYKYVIRYDTTIVDISTAHTALSHAPESIVGQPCIPWLSA